MSVSPKKVQRKSLPCGRIAPSHVPHEGLSLQSARDRLDDFAGTQGLRRSEIRYRILDVIVREARHFSVPELIQKVQRKHPEIGPATIYRNLPLLMESGLLRESLTVQGGGTIYELEEEDHHDHIVCTDCEQIFEFHDQAIESRQARVAEELGFRPTHHRHVIYASCELLKKKSRGKIG